MEGRAALDRSCHGRLSGALPRIGASIWPKGDMFPLPLGVQLGCCVQMAFTAALRRGGTVADEDTETQREAAQRESGRARPGTLTSL